MIPYRRLVSATRRGRLLATGLACLLLASTSYSADLILVRDGNPKAAIVVPGNADDALREVAVDMSQTIEAMSGASLRVVSDVDGPAIVFGGTDDSLEPLAYRVRRDRNRVVITGGSEQGVINGAYAFLEQELGVRWYTAGPLGTYIQKRATVSVGNVDFGDAPDYTSVRGFGPNESNPAEGAAWLRHNRLSNFPQQFHSHNWADFINPSRVEEHPVWYALVGERRSDQYCTTQPAVLDSAVAAAREFFDSHPEAVMYSLSPNDNGHFCQCDRCRALDAEIGVEPLVDDSSYTDRLVYFFNQIAAEVRKTHPDKRLSFYAYITHTEPPRTVKPDPMLIPVICHTPWEFCQHHAIDDEQCERNSRFAGIVRGWAAISPDVYIYDYYGHYGWYGPLGIVHTMRRDIPWLNAHGVSGFNSETHGNWWTQGLNFYVASKLFWDVNADVDAIVDEWHTDLYGPASEPMRAYTDHWEGVFASNPYDAAGDRYLGFIDSLTPEFLARSAAYLDEAEQLAHAWEGDAAERERVLERIRRVRYGHRLAVSQSESARFDPLRAGYPAQEVSPLEIVSELEADPELGNVIELRLARHVLTEKSTEANAARRVWTDTNIPGDVRQRLLGLVEQERYGEAAAGLGYVTTWRVLGLFGDPDMQGLKRTYGPEENLDLARSYDGKSGPVSWEEYRVDDLYGVVDFGELYADQGPESAVAFAYAEVENPGPGRYVQIRIGTNDGGILWHNGELVLMSDVERGITPDHDRLMVTLTPGTNTFLVKVINTGGKFKVAMRLLAFPRNEPILQTSR